MSKKNGTSSRRKMLKQLSIGTAATMASMPILSNLACAQAPAKKLGVALVGLGRYSNFMLGPVLQETEHAYLAGIVTGTPSKAKEWSKKYNIPEKNIYNYETFDQIADNPDIDIIYVVLPNFMHAEYTIRAAKAGKHVICEKPMAMNPKECEQMIKACDQANRLLSIGYRLHFEPHHREIMRLGQEKVFGKVKVVEASFGFNFQDDSSWRIKKALGGGGAIMDLGVYIIQASRYVTGEEPISVTAQAYTVNHQRFKDVHETICWQLIFPSGMVVNSTCTYGAYVDRFYASCEEGWFRLEPSYSAGGTGTAGVTSKGPMTLDKGNMVARQIDDFVHCIRTNNRSRISGEEGLKDMKIVTAILKAAETGKKIVLV